MAFCFKCKSASVAKTNLAVSSTGFPERLLYKDKFLGEISIEKCMAFVHAMSTKCASYGLRLRSTLPKVPFRGRVPAGDLDQLDPAGRDETTPL